MRRLIDSPIDTALKPPMDSPLSEAGGDGVRVLLDDAGDTLVDSGGSTLTTE